MIDCLAQFFTKHYQVASLVTMLSLFAFVLGVLLLPWLIALIPDSYFYRQGASTKDNVASIRDSVDQENYSVSKYSIFRRLIKNVVGVVFVATGIVLLITPGQGVLTLILGMMLLDYPGKKKIERKLLSYPPVLKLINSLRRRRGKREFIFPDD